MYQSVKEIIHTEHLMEDVLLNQTVLQAIHMPVLMEIVTYVLKVIHTNGLMEDVIIVQNKNKPLVQLDLVDHFTLHRTNLSAAQLDTWDILMEPVEFHRLFETGSQKVSSNTMDPFGSTTNSSEN